MEKDFQKIREFAKEHKWLIAAIIIVAILAYIISQMAFANWLFQMKFNGWWMLNKAGINIWDITFEKGYYWQTLWIIPLIWFLCDPIFWRKRATMKLFYKLIDEDIEKNKF